MTDAKIKDRLSIDGSPSGKASDFDSDTRRFESYPVCQHGSQLKTGCRMVYTIAPFRVCGLTKQVGMVEIARRMEIYVRRGYAALGDNQHP